MTVTYFYEIFFICEKTRSSLSTKQNFFRQINLEVSSLVKTLISRNFWHKVLSVFQIRVSKKCALCIILFFSFFQKLREIDWTFRGSNIFTKEELKESISRKKILREWISRFSTLAFLPQHIISFSLITWNQLIKNVFYMRCFQLQFVNDLFFLHCVETTFIGNYGKLNGAPYGESY